MISLPLFWVCSLSASCGFVCGCILTTIFRVPSWVTETD